MRSSAGQVSETGQDRSVGDQRLSCSTKRTQDEGLFKCFWFSSTPGVATVPRSVRLCVTHISGPVTFPVWSHLWLSHTPGFCLSLRGAAPPLGFPWKLVVPQPLMLMSRGMKHDQLGPQNWLPSEARAPDGCCSSALPTLHLPPDWVSIRWEKLPAGLRDYISIPFPVLSDVVVYTPSTQRREMVS